MNVNVDDIRGIKPGTLQLFACESAKNIRTARTLISIIKDTETMQKGVVNYESKTYKLETGRVMAIRALRENDIPMLNVKK